MDYIKDIWAGYIQSFASDASRPAILVVDFLLAGISYYFLLNLLNSRAGWRFLGLLVGALIILIGSSLFQLSGLHLLSQAMLVGLVIALPVLFREQFSQLLSGEKPSPSTSMSRGIIIAGAVILGAATVLLGNGVTTKTGELPADIPIVATNLADGLSSNFGSDHNVRVVVSASRQAWRNLNSDSFSATVDVAKQAAGTYDLAINVTSKVAGVEIRRVNPKRVSVSVEPVIKKTVPVVVKFSGQAGNDLVADTANIDPEKVEITGAKSVIANLSQAVAAVKLNGETATITQNVTLTVLDTNGEAIQGVSINPAEATVIVPLLKSGKIKNVGVQANITGAPAAGYWVKSVTLSPSVVPVTGPADVLEALTSLGTAQVSVAGLGNDKTFEVDLALPPGITVADSSKKITVKITVEQTSTTKAVTPQLNYSGVDSALQVSSTNPTSISALVSGANSLLASLSDASVKINLDLSAYQSAGTYSVTIKNTDFQLPDGVGLVSFLPSVISVTLNNK